MRIKGSLLSPSRSIATQILETLARKPACEFQQLVVDCSEFTWKQLFYEVDRLNQLGQLRLTSADGGHYFIRLPLPEEVMTPGQVLAVHTYDHPAAAQPRSVELVARHTSIAQRAYQLYEMQGRPHGRALDHWLQAEREIEGQ